MTDSMLKYFFLLLIILVFMIMVDAHKYIEKSNKLNISEFKNKWIIIVWLLLASGLIIFALCAPTIFTSGIHSISTTSPSDSTSISNSYSIKGQIGDAMGGIMNPFISIAAVIVTGLAFYAQYNANKLIQDQFEIQRFEDQFYEMLEIHIENVKNMEINGNIQGKKCFVRMFNELEYISRLFYSIFKNEENGVTDIQKIRLNNNFIYHHFFYGVGPHSIKILKHQWPNIGIDVNHLSPFNTYLSALAELYWKNKDENGFLEYEVLRDLVCKEKNLRVHCETLPHMELNLYYQPFDGHINRLSNYYRHLYLLVSFVVDSRIIKEESKKNYMKIIRAQLSNHEQMLLYYNSFASFGQKWISKRIFSDYRFIKNASFELIDFGDSPIDYFKLLAKEPNTGFEIRIIKDIENNDIETLINKEKKIIFDFQNFSDDD